MSDPEGGRLSVATMPHCDSSILHAPGVCKFCDERPDWQAYRLAARINFTGEHDEDMAPCPSEWFRSPDKRDRWPGNVPVAEGTEPPSYFSPGLLDQINTARPQPGVTLDGKPWPQDQWVPMGTTEEGIHESGEFRPSPGQVFWAPGVFPPAGRFRRLWLHVRARLGR